MRTFTRWVTADEANERFVPIDEIDWDAEFAALLAARSAPPAARDAVAAAWLRTLRGRHPGVAWEVS